MSRFNGFLRWAWSILVVCTLGFALGGCEGDDGAAGPAGTAGPPGPAGPPGTLDAVTASIEKASAESCSTCHDGIGDGHQAIYNQYADASDFVLTIDAVNSVGAGPYDVTIDFSIDYMGAAFDVDPASSSWVDGLFFAVSHWDDTAEMFQLVGGPFDPFSGITGPITNNGGGSYTLTASLAYDIDSWDSGAIVGKLTDNPISFPDGPTAHFAVYDDLSVDAIEVGAGSLAADFQSVANVSGCETCHGAPYRKHGNIQASVPGAPDFTYCKSCHYDDRIGGHTEWQYMVDEPFNWATGVAETADYSYTANVMNVTHMSHAMEFPYPMSMSNCNTCHEGKLDRVISDELFTAETCKSCHAVQGLQAWPTDPPQPYAQGNRAPPLQYLWDQSGFAGIHDINDNCSTCHSDPLAPPFTGIAVRFEDIHSGYDSSIYNDVGQKYAVLNPVTIDQITVNGDLLTINFSAVNTDIVPEVLVSFYGWDSKNFIVGSHERDSNAACTGFRTGCKMEYVPESSGGSANPLFVEDAASIPGAWMVTLDMSALQLTKTDLIPALIADGTIKIAEVTINPELEIGGEKVILAAVNQTFDLGGSVLVADYFKGANATVSIDKCNVCHDSLASTFHDGSGRGGDGIEACKHCHTTTFPGGHLEMASRAIDSYVHAIHSFQVFDLDEVGTDPVYVARSEQHALHTFPNFTITNCEACHLDGTYNVPDQSKSMPGVLSASWDIPDRNIGTVPEVVTGPASRACGGCHRADLINADLAGDLASLNAHVEAFGTLEENDADDEVLFGIIEKIMGMFE